MAKVKRNVVKQAQPTELKPRTWWAKWGPFLEDWGRLVIPAGAAAIIVALRLLGVVDDTGSGFIVGLLVLAGLYVGCAAIVFFGEFPKWVRASTIALGLVFLAGMVAPFADTIYPGIATGGSPAFQTTVVKDSPETPVTGDVGSGWYSVEVFAKSLADGGELKGEGQYKLLVGGQEVAGKFSDTMRQVRATRRGGTRQVEQKHLMEVRAVTFADGAKTLKAVRLDTNIGPELRVSIFPVLVPPPLVYVLVGLALVFGILVDGMFQEQTERWRLAPFVGMAVAFLLIFGSSYERGSVTSGAIWSTIFGGVVGFLGGWLLSLIGRRVIGRLRTKV
jgi:hypothetical protein